MDEHGRTALWAACRGGAMECIKLLMERGADPDNMDDRQGTFDAGAGVGGLYSRQFCFTSMTFGWQFAVLYSAICCSRALASLLQQPPVPIIMVTCVTNIIMLLHDFQYDHRNHDQNLVFYFWFLLSIFCSCHRAPMMESRKVLGCMPSYYVLHFQS